MALQITQIDGYTWIFDEGGVRFFLLTGEKRALLIDSGMQTREADRLAREFTKLPLSLINTHADPDHIGSNGRFARFYLSPAECSNYYNSQGRSGVTDPVREGDMLDLGGRLLRVYEIPGHTPGSIALLDEVNRRIFTGDPVQDGRIFMFGIQREMHAYVQSVRRLMALAAEDAFDWIYPSHGSCPLSPAILAPLAEAAETILAGKAKGTPAQVFGKPIVAYDMGVATFLCDRPEEEKHETASV